MFNRCLLALSVSAVFFVGCAKEEYVPPAEAIPEITPGRSAGDEGGGPAGKSGGKLSAPTK